MRNKTRAKRDSTGRVKPDSLANQVYEKIRKEIITCALKPGQPIAQPHLVDKYQVGITPVREALQRLAQEGFVDPIPRFGYFVRQIAIADVDEIYELRSILESAAVRLAIRRGSDEQLARIVEHANFTYIYKDPSSYYDFLTHNNEFHRLIALAAGNRKLVDAIAITLDQLTRVFHLGLDVRDSAEEMRREHLALAEAIKVRDADHAERILNDQNERSRARVLEALLGKAANTLTNDGASGRDKRLRLLTIR